MNQFSEFFLNEDDCEAFYRNVRDISSSIMIEARLYVEELWAIYEPYADQNFRSDAKKHLLERFWEMYLGVTLIENGFSIYSERGDGPEFSTELDGHKVWWEAIAPGPGEGDDALPERDYGPIPKVSIEPSNEILLRLRHAIREKHMKYESDLDKNIITERDSYVIAINSKRMGPFIIGGTIPYIIQAVFPFGDLQVVLDKTSLEISDSFHKHRDKIYKKSGSEIRTDVFFDHKFSGISAVLFSGVDPVNRRTGFGHDFQLVHNPMAKNPIDIGQFKFGTEYWYEDDELISTVHNS